VVELIIQEYVDITISYTPLYSIPTYTYSQIYAHCWIWLIYTMGVIGTLEACIGLGRALSVTCNIFHFIACLVVYTDLLSRANTNIESPLARRES
jgi:hypothetical protein